MAWVERGWGHSVAERGRARQIHRPCTSDGCRDLTIWGICGLPPPDNRPRSTGLAVCRQKREKTKSLHVTVAATFPTRDMSRVSSFRTKRSLDHILALSPLGVRPRSAEAFSRGIPQHVRSPHLHERPRSAGKSRGSPWAGSCDAPHRRRAGAVRGRRRACE